MYQCHQCGKTIDPDNVYRRDVATGSTTGYIGSDRAVISHQSRVSLCMDCAATQDESDKWRNRLMIAGLLAFIVGTPLFLFGFYWLFVR